MVELLVLLMVALTIREYNVQQDIRDGVTEVRYEDRPESKHTKVR